MVKVGVVGYGVIGQRLADGVASQEDMKLIGVCDIAPTLSVRALNEKGMPYNLFNTCPENQDLFNKANSADSSSDEKTEALAAHKKLMKEEKLDMSFGAILKVSADDNDARTNSHVVRLFFLILSANYLEWSCKDRVESQRISDT